jgi:hypothetical protein
MFIDPSSPSQRTPLGVLCQGALLRNSIARDVSIGCCVDRHCTPTGCGPSRTPNYKHSTPLGGKHSRSTDEVVAHGLGHSFGFGMHLQLVVDAPHVKGDGVDAYR